MKKSTAKFRGMMVLLVIALLLLIPMNSYSTDQNISSLEAEMEHLENILAQMDNGTLERSYNIDSIVYENHSCNQTGYEISKVLTGGRHHLEFTFGNIIKHADNDASYNITGCTVLDDPGATYYLNTSIIGSTTSYCMNISANNVVLDCQGHTIDGNDAADYGIYIHRGSEQTTNITIRNCILTDWDVANIRLEKADKNTFTNITANSCPWGGSDRSIHLIYSDFNNFTNITINSNYYGFYLYYSNNNTFSGISANSNNYDFYIYYSNLNNFTDIASTGSGNYGFRIEYSEANNIADAIYDNSRDNPFYAISNSHSTTIINSVANSCFRGFYFQNSNSATIINCTANSNSLHGFESYNSFPFTIINCTAKENAFFDIYLEPGQNMDCKTKIENFTGSNNLPFMYFNSSVNISDEQLSGLILCDADNSNITNVTINASQSKRNNMIYITKTDNSRFTGIVSSSNYYGIYIYDSDFNNFTDIKTESNDMSGFYIRYSNSNNIADAISSSNDDYGFYMDNSDNNYFSNITSGSNDANGFRMSYSDFNTIKNCTLNSNDDYGFYISASQLNTIRNITAKETYRNDDFYMAPNSESYCRNIIENITGSNNLPVKYFNSSVNISNEELSGLILCNADNSNITNVTINASQSYKNNNMHIIRTDNSNFADIVSSENHYGIQAYYSNLNTFTNITTNLNQNNGIYFDNSDSNNITDSTASYNTENGFYISDSDLNTIVNVTANSNSQYGVYIKGTGNSIFDSTAISNNYGFYIQSGTGNSIFDSTAISNGYAGIYSYADYVAINGSTISGSQYGVWLGYGVNYINITHSTIISNYQGVCLYACNHNILIANSTISDNSDCGIFFDNDWCSDEGNHYIYNNLFNNSGMNGNVRIITGINYPIYFNTTKQNGTKIHSTGNLTGGNFWTNSIKTGYSDTCIDYDTDGICDNPYDMSVGTTVARDYLPLTWIKIIYVSVNLDKTLMNTEETINISGHAILQPTETSVNNTDVSVWINNVFRKNCTTNSNGDYSCNVSAPIDVGTHTIKVNMTDSNGVRGENQTTFEVRQLKIDNWQITDSHGETDAVLYSLENFNITMWLREYDGSQYFNVTGGTFNIRINETDAYATLTHQSGALWKASFTAPNTSGAYNIIVNGSSANAINGDNSTTFTIPENFNITLLDSSGSAILNNYITVYKTGTSTIACEGSTDSGGKYSCNLETTTNYDIDIENCNGNLLNISAPDNLTLQPLNITVLDHSSTPKDNVQIDIYSAGRLISTSATDSNGYTNFTLNNSNLYNITVFNNTQPSIFDAAVPSSKTINLNLSITASLEDTIVMPDTINKVSGNIHLLPDNAPTTSTPVYIYLDESLVNIGSHLSKTFSGNYDFSNGTSVNVTNSSGAIVLDSRGEYYFEAENYSAQANATVQTNMESGWEGEPSQDKYIFLEHPGWSLHNITGIPNGTYYIFVKMYAGASDRMADITWDGNLVGTTSFGSYSSDILWTNKLSQTVTVNSSAHNLNISTISNIAYIDVILLTTNASFVPDNTDQNYAGTPLKYSGNFISNKTTTTYSIISITPSWYSSEPTGSNITIDISADNGASWCIDINQSQEYRQDAGCGSIGSGAEITWRANLNTNNSFAGLKLHNITLNYETGNATKTNSSGQYAFLFNGGSALGWHTVKVNATDTETIYGNTSAAYYIDNLSITTDTAPDTIDADTHTQTLNININSNAGRASAKRYNITATITNPDATEDIISNSSFSCDENYPMTCTASWTPGTIQPFGLYNVTIDYEDNESITGQNTTYNDFRVDNITTTIISSELAPIIPKDIMISGTAQTYAASTLSIANATITTSAQEHICGYNTSMTSDQYNWSINCSINSSQFSDELGPATVTVKINDTTGNLFGINTTAIEIWAPAKVNYTTTINYTAGTNTKYNITGYYWRTDKPDDESIIGLINITLFNETYSISKTCASAETCLKTFTVGPTGELKGGNYTIYINATNSSAYYMPNSTQYNIYLEEPKATGILNAEDKLISDMIFGVDYLYVQTVTLNNSGKSAMNTPYIVDNNNCGAGTIVSIENATPLYCANTPPNSVCQVLFNITVAGASCSSPPCEIGCLDWHSNWTNNDGTIDSETITQYIIYISGNPDMSVSQALINITDNIGSENTTAITLNNAGNENLGVYGNPSNSIFVDYIEGTLPSSWVSFSSGETLWDSADDYWDYQTKEDDYIFNVHIIADNYTAGIYTGIVNITSYKLNTLQTYEEINISITISPGLTLSQESINYTNCIGSPNITNISVQSAGNSPITNVTVHYIMDTMPASWLNFSSIDSAWNDSTGSFNQIDEYTSKTLSMNLTALDYTPGIYTGKINITTNENIYRTINISTTIAPAINISIKSINITQNISQANSTIAVISSAGNAPITNVTIELVNSTMPANWITLSSIDSDWNGTTQSFSRIAEETNRTLNITLKATEYMQGTYTGILNITSKESQNTQINLSITIIPEALTYNLSTTKEHGVVAELYHIVNSTGNAPLINANITYIESSLPSAWVLLKYESQSNDSVDAGNITENTYKNITVEITIPEFQAPGTYIGYINTTFDNEPYQQKTITININTNSSWHIAPPVNQSREFVLSEAGVIGNVTILNTGNIPLNYTITYITNGICEEYTCMGGSVPDGDNPSYIYVNKNSSETFNIWQRGNGNTKYGARIIANITNSSGTPIDLLAYMQWNITNNPPILITLAAQPKNYVELNKSTTLFAVISDDEDVSSTTGMDLSSVYFNVTDPDGHVYHIDNNSVYYWETTYIPPELDRKSFNASFLNTSVTGIHNLTVYIKDKSGNSIAANLFQFEVIGAITTKITATAPPTAENVTLLHGENLTIPINITNTGKATAYNITLTGTFGSGAETWTVWNKTYDNLSEAENIETNITITVAQTTVAGNYQFTPKIEWMQPDLSQSQNATDSALTVSVASNPEITPENPLETSIDHAESKKITFQVNSTGNSDYNSPKLYVVNQTAPLEWICFNNYCSNGGTTIKSYAEFIKNDVLNIPVYIEVPAGTVPGNYTSQIEINSTSYASSRYKTANVTITVLEDRNWTLSRPYNQTSFDLNTPGTIANITISNIGNIQTNFTITYNNWSDTDYYAYTGLFNESQNNSGTIVNPTSLLLQPNEVKNITIYQNGHYQGLENIGINITIANLSASPVSRSALAIFNLTEAPPEISYIAFFNESYIELNKTIGIKIVASDDASINLTTIELNITNPNSETTTVYPDTTNENQTAHGKYIMMNYTYLLNSTAINGTHIAEALICDEFGYCAQSSQYAFEVIGETSFTLAPNQSSYPVSHISQSLSNNLTIPINITNTGLVTAYNATLTGVLSQNASAWTIHSKSLGNISGSSLTGTNITLAVANATWPGSYCFTPKITWQHPNGTSAEYSCPPVSIIIASNKTVVFEDHHLDFTIMHGTTNSTQIKISSTGNDNTSSIELYRQNIASNMTVTLNQTTIPGITAGQSKYIIMNITPAPGTVNDTYTFDIALYHDGALAETYHYTVIVPTSFSWEKNTDETTINGVSGQDAIDESTSITNTGNNPISYTISLAGNITDYGIMELAESMTTIQPLDSYNIRLNHIAPNQNNYFEGTLKIQNGTYYENIKIKYHSYIADLNIVNISPNYNIISADSINITTQFTFGSNNITESTIYTIKINNTNCAITQNTTQGGYMTHTCTAPAVPDGLYHDIEVTADYTWETGIISITETNTSAIHYKDITAPVITLANSTADTEINNNITVDFTATDNIEVSAKKITIYYPNSTLYHATPMTGTSTQVQMPSTIGIYTINYTVNDTTGNINSTATTFEVYEWKNISGCLIDLESEIVDTSFDILESENTIHSFSTDTRGCYNATIKRKTYDLNMNFLDAEITINNVDFSALPADFIGIDTPILGDFGFGETFTVIKGFAVNTSISSSGSIIYSYIPADVGALNTDHLEIYRCTDWNYNARTCDGLLTEITDTKNKLQRKLNASFSSLSAIILVHKPPSQQPEMTIPSTELIIYANHSQDKNTTLTIQSTGSVALSNIRFECSDGDVCTSFSLSGNTISGLDAGASYDAPLTMHIPQFTPPGIYTGELVVSSNQQSVYAQQKTVDVTVNVAEDNTWTTIQGLSLTGIGSGVNGTVGSILIRNEANVPLSFAIIPNATYINVAPENIVIAKNNTDTITVNHNPLDEVMHYNASIIINTTGVSRVVYATINVTHAINITSIEPSTNISMGQIIEINATANYLGAIQTENMTWNAYVDSTPCVSVTSNYSDMWSVLCEAPNMSAKLYYTLKLEGRFTGHEGETAYDTAYDLDNIYYVDVLPPRIRSKTPSCEKTDANTTVDAVITDYSNVSSVYIEIFAPDGSKICEKSNISNVGNDTYSFQYNFTSLGDYIIKYTPKDTLNNSGTIEQYFEVYRNITFLGDINKADGSGQQASFKFYRQNQSYSDAQLLDQFTTYSNGSYNVPRMHDRFYDIEITADSNTIRMYNVNLTNHSNDPVDIDIVPGNEVQITGTTELGGIAVKSTIASHGRVTLQYVPDAGTKEDNIYIYKCEDWNYTETKCDGEWVVQERSIGNINKIYNTISVDISSFSAYIAAESVPLVPPGTIIYSTTGSAGGSSSGGSSINTSHLEESVGALKEAIEELKGTQVINGVEVETDIIQRQLFAGERTSVPIRVRNTLNTRATVTLDSTGEISRYIAIKKRTITLEKGEESEFTVEIEMPYNTRPGNYHGTIIVSIGDKSASIPVTVHVLESREDLVKIDLSLYTDTAYLNSSISYELNIDNIGGLRNLDMLVDTILINPLTLEIYSSTHHDLTINASTKVDGIILIPGNITTGEYTIKATAKYAHNNQTVEATSIKPIKITAIPLLWYNKNIIGIAAWKLLLAGFVLSLLSVSGALYLRKEQRKKRYTATVDFKSLPQPGAFAAFIGNIAETGIRAFFDLNKLQTHMIVAGATGGGKTMAAQVLVEEALLKGKNVIVFDPTAQWTGFLRKCTYRKMLAQYSHFQMKRGDARAFNGNVHTIQNFRQLIDIRKYMIPGEIHIFTINKLKPEEIDMFVASTVRQVFQANMEESQELKTLIVYDEVHRLLPKFGGSGDGFIQIERAVREFRKWGIGLILISQALTDFIGTIKANIGTEIQVRTRDESDLKRIETKYGQDMMKSIIKASVGTGMVENAEYNRGKPYFVTFRPPLHSIVRLSDAELENYRKYNDKIDDLLYQIEQLKAEDVDVFDIELEVKLALDKLKIGSFSMVDIYLESLEPRIKAHWAKLGRAPRAHNVSFIEERDLKSEIDKAKRMRKIYDVPQNIKKPVEQSIGTKKERKTAASSQDNISGNRHPSQDTKRDKPHIQAKNDETRDHPLPKLEHKRDKKTVASATLKEDYETLKEDIEKKGKEGKDTSLLQVDVVNVPALIQMAEATGDKKDILTAKTKIKSIRKELDSL